MIKLLLRLWSESSKIERAIILIIVTSLIIAVLQ
jgi:hypothetical protein